MKMKLNFSRQLLRIAVFALAAILLSLSCVDLQARPTTKKGGSSQVQTFYRQRNNLSNIDFFLTNKGILFNDDAVAGCNWPRGTANSYIFGGGMWFATQKVIGGKKRKLCELGYNPNSGAGWFTEGEINSPTSNAAANYISYLSPRYSKSNGAYDQQLRASVVSPYAHWPIWDTAAKKTLNRNYYFGDYIADEGYRGKLHDLAASGTALANGKVPKPAMLSQEDIVNIYTDEFTAANPEYKAGQGYPFGLNIVEVVYSWSFGKYRDMIFLRRKVTNASTDSLIDCFVTPAFDPDLGVGGGAAGNDINSYFGLSAQDIQDSKTLFPPSSPYYGNPEALNLARQWSKSEATAVPSGEYGCIGFAFLESPITTTNGQIVDISDSAAVSFAANGNYCAGLQRQLGMTSFKQWTISNDPPTADLRYDFCADGTRDHDISIVADMRLLFATGPFTLPPGKSVETTTAIGIARPSTTNVKLNQDSVVKLMAFAHKVFADTTGSYLLHADSGTCVSVVKHFVTPVPPEIPTLSTQCLDRAVLVSWDYASDSSKDPLSATLPFVSYDLYRTTRSDHDSTIRPDGINPIVHLGSWSLYNFRQDSTFDTVKVGTLRFVSFAGYKYTRTNSTPNQVPHTFLDYGDDNQDGQITGSEGLYNGVQYYYFLTATDEYDSINKIGPLTTAIVQPKNFVSGIPCKPIFPDLPNIIAGDSGCLNGALASLSCSKPSTGTEVSIDILDTGKFVQLYANDTVYVSFQPRWTEFANVGILNQSYLNMYVDVTDTRQGKVLTYDKLYNPFASPVYTPYSYATGIFQQVLGQSRTPLCDSNVTGKFTTNNTLFAPYETVDQAFDIAVAYQMKQLPTAYAIHSITADPNKIGMIHVNTHTSIASGSVNVDMNNLDSVTRPSYLGSLGEVSYDITFGAPVSWSEDQYDAGSGKIIYGLNHLKDTSSGSGADYHPNALPIKITSPNYCGQALSVIRPGNSNDIAFENENYYYHTPFVRDPSGNVHPDYTNPDSIIVPLGGKFAMDAYHFSEDSPGDPSIASFFLKTTGMYYFPFDAGNQSAGKTLATVHRLRLGGAEIMLNFPQIPNAKVNGGDSTIQFTPVANDFKENDKISVSFVGLMKGLPFPGAKFMIETSKNKHLDFTDNSLYEESKILNEVQVVPNPYIVEHIGQTSTDDGKLFFTRLPPRATIEIYNIAGELIKTLHHNGYQPVTDAAGDIVSYNYSQLADRYNVETWNLLSEGLQRVGSQVFVARIIAQDKSGANIAETTTKFAVVLGGYRLVH
jgi:hypothetical protein